MVARDSFEETVKSGLFEIERSSRTFLGTSFDTALDQRTHEMLITTDVPLTEKGEMPPPQKLFIFTFNEMSSGLAKPVRQVNAVRVLAGYRFSTGQKLLRRKAERYIR